MLSILLPIVLAPLLPMTHIVMRVVLRKKNLHAFFFANIVYVLAVFVILFPNQQFAPDTLFFIGFFALGYLEFFSLIDRGFSNQMLVEALRSKKPLTSRDFQHLYSHGRGMDWMLQKRLRHMESLLMISLSQHKIQIRPFGYLLGMKSLMMKQVFRQ